MENQKINKRQGKYYAIGYLLDYDYIKNHYGKKSIGISQRKENKIL